jgi:hypothetical protein
MIVQHPDHFFGGNLVVSSHPETFDLPQFDPSPNRGVKHANKIGYFWCGIKGLIHALLPKI